MNPDLYAAWVTAGTNLQAAGDWCAANWPWLAIPVTAALVIWRGWRSNAYRTRNDRQAAWLAACNGTRPEPAQPGHDDGLLDQCQAICPDLARKGDTP